MLISAYLATSGLTDIGYQFYNPNETANGSRITAGVVDAGDGWYSADATFSAGVASVRWNSAGTASVIAREYFDFATAGFVWQVLTSTLTLAGSVGKLVADDIDAKISTRSTYAGTDTAGTTTLLSRIASAITITSGKVDVNDKTGFSLTAVYDPAKTAMQAGPVTVSVNNDKTGYALTAAQVVAIADALLQRDWSLVTGEASASVLNALRAIRNKWTLSTDGTLTVYKENDIAAAWTRQVTTDPNALPITGQS